ncbi:T9SS type A sorting domain-containing protein [Fluviicola taffensis]|uniref:Hyalin repeat-containing protein n=1 Tax=Fluviicola taffensis (strain DSM 16823 / NCIMB 13979 / RW262) TaxID=755732 RepID=F2IHN0_FLUTR|nr:T9SS type A sorting domain-containing protein [Fluviicola taffensis]AEA44808.1 hyalin repeat-containing protein [Fluviicola taffensis DSM 16823]
MKKVIVLGLILLGNLSNINAQILMTDLRPGLDGSEPVFDNAFQRNNELYFIANPDGITSRLYKTDGTSGNTVVLEGGSNMYVTMLLGFLGNNLLYVAGDIYNGESLGIYKTNGSIGAGELVLSFNQPGSFLVTYPMTITMNNVLYFYGSDDVAGFELWRTDGTTAGTYLVKDINPGTETSLLFSVTKQYFAELNGFIYFGAADPVNGAELWKSDGTEAGTNMVANIDTSEAIVAQYGSNPAYFCTYNNAVYFSAHRPVDGRELWKTDGTEAGTVLVKDLAAGSGSPSNMIEYNGLLYFTAFYPNENYTLYKSNGTNAGTVAVKPAGSGGPVISPDDPFVIFKGKLFFAANDGLNGQGFPSIWYSDGTAAGTSSLPAAPAPYTSHPLNLLATTNYLYYTANVDANNTNYGVYRTTGLNNQNVLLTSATFDANAFQPLHLVNSCLLVRGDNNGATGEEIYTVCNQNTQPVGLEESFLVDLTAFPNPAADQLTIESSSDLNEVNDLKLQSLSGKSVNLEYAVSNDGTILITGLSEFNSGVYFLTITTKNGANRQLKLMIE